MTKKQKYNTEDNRGVAIYARKSRITNKGDSIGVQFKQCAEYAKRELKLDDEYNFLEYEDKGLSGYYSDRPDFQRMLHDIEMGKIRAVVCYKLDRIGRKTSDLLRLLDFLEKHKVDLLICSNNINTASGVSKIFIQIFAVVAEFERDTLTERITDNMMELAKDGRWLGRQCARGKVLYVNLELDKASCLHRFFDVYKAMHLPRNHIQNIEIWNLRGQSVPMDKLAPKLIRRAEKQHFIAVIIDPIYKVITGDENSADQMANFCNQFDKICTALGCSVIYCHHHSKGAQGDKRSMDRASGSGVFARDPDALLDLIELEITDSLRAQEENKAVCAAMLQAINELEPAVLDDIPQDDQCSSTALQKRAQQLLSKVQYDLLCDRVEDAKRGVAGYTAWRMEGTLREFPKFSPVNCWFRYPIHEVDSIGSLADLQADSHWQANLKKSSKRRRTPEQRKADQKQALDTAFDCCCNDGVTSIKELSNYMGVSEKTVRNYIENHGNYWIDNGEVGRKKG